MQPWSLLSAAPSPQTPSATAFGHPGAQRCRGAAPRRAAWAVGARGQPCHQGREARLGRRRADGGEAHSWLGVTVMTLRLPCCEAWHYDDLRPEVPTFSPRAIASSCLRRCRRQLSVTCRVVPIKTPYSSNIAAEPMLRWFPGRKCLTEKQPLPETQHAQRRRASPHRGAVSVRLWKASPLGHCCATTAR